MAKVSVRLVAGRSGQELDLRVQEVPEGAGKLNVEAQARGDDHFRFDLSISVGVDAISGEGERHEAAQDPALTEAVHDPDGNVVGIERSAQFANVGHFNVLPQSQYQQPARFYVGESTEGSLP